MQETKKKNNGGNEDSKKKERHIVTWTQQEDDILRQQISLHGTENWAIIASKFKDKTTRQCRRRWYTYLNSDFKKGGWSPEEDMLLCEAQKIFGNRWTEIAKVVSGRTDNAVKNRFSTLCKKRAKYEALAKENRKTYINSNNKRILFHNGFNADGILENAAPDKRTRRSHIPDHSEHCKLADRSHPKQQSRPPLADTGSTLTPYTTAGKTEQNQVEVGELHEDVPNELQSVLTKEQSNTDECEKGIISLPNVTQGGTFPSFDEDTNADVVVSVSSSTEFSSPFQVTPVFRSLAAGIPSPKFSESERNFLLKTLGVESPCLNPSTNPSQPPPCRRALLQSL
uniref:MYB family protein n=1 Tax=Manihot esculenta TaxID=3983 RepID=A0A2C9WM65_MANES